MPDSDPLSAHLARPGQSLGEHVAGVANAITTMSDGAGTTPYGDDWGTVLQTLAWTHDIGKLTDYFQTYLDTGDRDHAPTPQHTYHATFGGLVTLRALASCGCSPETTAAGFYAVVKHHSELSNVRPDLQQFYLDKTAVDSQYEIARDQLDNVDETASEAADALLRRATDGALGWDEVAADGLDLIRQSLKEIHARTDGDEFYGCVLRAWSSLVAADKFDASGLISATDAGPLNPPERLSAGNVTETVRALSDTRLPDGDRAAAYLDDPDRPIPDTSATTEQRLAALRTAANARATATLQSRHADGERTFELTLPTGFGKTLAGLRAALTLADSRASRVVYALPYTSIIDQVDADVRELFDVTPLDPAYTKHHHLADTRTVLNKGANADRPSTGETMLHAEAWRSDLVLTTFTQLFESVAGPGNVQSTKLPALQDSVIVVDEPQAVSLDWWGLVGRLTRYLTTEYDATVVFMTATQPRILNRLPGAPTPTPLVDLGDECAEFIADHPRVEFDLHPGLVAYLDDPDAAPLTLADAASELETDLVDPPRGESQNTLAIVNTVGSAVRLTELLSTDTRVHLADGLVRYHRETEGPFDPEAYLQWLAAADSTPDALLATLTTRLRPADREALLASLRRVLDPRTTTPFDDVPTLTVSTQLIEAGVDVSFDRLYRDFAPLPAIVQAAGRCNRSFGASRGQVTVWRLDSPPDDDYVPSRLIYGDRSLLRPTQTALDTLRGATDRATLSESPVVTSGVARYYETLHEQRRTDSRTDTLVDAFDSARGEQLRNASLITNDYPTRDVLVLVTDQDADAYGHYRRHRDANEWRAAREAFQTLKRALVSIPVRTAHEDDDLLAVTPDEIETRYELVSGRGVRDLGSPTDSEV